MLLILSTGRWRPRCTSRGDTVEHQSFQSLPMGSLRNDNQISHLGPLNGQYRTLPRGVEDIKRNRRRRWHLRNAPRGQAPVKDGHLYCSPVPSGFRASYGFPAGVVAADPPRGQSSKRQPAPIRRYAQRQATSGVDRTEPNRAAENASAVCFDTTYGQLNSLTIRAQTLCRS